MTLQRLVGLGVATLCASVISASAGQAPASAHPAQASSARPAQAQGPAKKTPPSAAMRYEVKGQVVSINGTSLVLTHQVNGKEQKESFVVNTATHRPADLKAGAMVTVAYHREGVSRIATAITLQPAQAKK